MKIAKLNTVQKLNVISKVDKNILGGVVAGTVDTREGFIINEKIMVEGSLQYKVHNSKG